MRFFCAVFVLTVALFQFSHSATNYEIEAKKFIDDASTRYYSLYNRIAEETYSSTDDEDFEMVFSKLSTVKKIANELVQISQEAGAFDMEKIQDESLKKALQSLRIVGNLFVLGDEYFSSVLVNTAALKTLSTDKDIDPYLGGINMPDQDDSALAYFPDIQKIFQRSSDTEELQYYWESWREKNLVWSSINFYTIVEAFQNAAKILGVPILDYWYRYYNNKDFLLEMERVMKELKPNYEQMHAFVRQELFKKYGHEVIDPNGPIPDHLYQQVLDQTWFTGSVIEKYFPYDKLPPYDEFVNHFEASEIIDEAERFYKSLGFGDLDEKFLKERLKEHNEEGNTGDCRAAILDLTPSVYMKYCKKVDFKKFMQSHGYLSRVHYASQKQSLPSYYFNSYDLEYPVGEAVILSASTPKHLAAIGLAKDFKFTDETLTNRLFRMGIHTMFNIPTFFVHSKVMNDLLNGTVDMEGVNKHYWKLMEQHVGVEPPVERPEGAIDFPYKFYWDMEDNYQTKKFVSEILGYQFYRAFCKKTGDVSALHNCDFFGNLSVGNDLKAMMSLGSSRPWREVIGKVLPKDETLSAEALLEYYKPILDWVGAKNKETKAKVGWNASKNKVL